MNDKFSKLLDKKKGKESLSPMERSAKESVLQHLLADATAEMGGKLQGLKKVTVAAPDEGGLEHGLDKAKELLAAHKAGALELPEGDEGDLGEAEEGDEGQEDEPGELSDEGETLEHDGEPGADEDEGLDEEALNAKLEKLMKLKERMKRK